MVWAILALLGVPLWICAAGITVLVLKNRGLRNRPGDIPVRVKLPEQDALDAWPCDLGLRRIRLAGEPRFVERGPSSRDGHRAADARARRSSTRCGASVTTSSSRRSPDRAT